MQIYVYTKYVIFEKGIIYNNYDIHIFSEKSQHDFNNGFEKYFLLKNSLDTWLKITPASNGQNTVDCAFDIIMTSKL